MSKKLENTINPEEVIMFSLLLGYINGNEQKEIFCELGILLDNSTLENKEKNKIIMMIEKK